MARRMPFFLQFCLLLAILVRTAIGAPCCLGDMAGEADTAQTTPHAMHAMADHGGDETSSGHGDHADGDNLSNPCCSACGPTLGSDPVNLAASAKLPASFVAFDANVLPPRDLLREYDATGPPVRV